MEMNTLSVIAFTIIVVVGLICSTIIAKYAFAKDAAGLEPGEADLILRLGTVGIVVLAGLFFAALGVLEKAIPFLAPIAAFVLGGIKGKTR